MLLPGGFKAPGKGTGPSLKRTFDQMQAQSKPKISQQVPPGQAFDSALMESQLAMKMPNTESFDKILS